MSKMFLQSKHKEGARFEILSFDQETKIARLRGQYAAVFEQPITADRLKKYGYRIEKETEEE